VSPPAAPVPPPASAPSARGPAAKILPDDGAGLNAKQRRFCLEYLVDMNGTQAAIRAGYAARSAHSQASDLLTLPKVQAFLQPRLKRAEEKLELTAERLEAELARLAFVDPRKAYDANGKLLPVHEMPEDVARAIAGFEEEALFDTIVVGEGPRGGVKKERLQVGVTRKVKWASKPEALALGMKRLGLLTEKHELVGPANVTINIGVRRKKAAGAAGQGK
jgi:phage terminase small subunit